MGATIGDGLCVLGIALIILAAMTPIIFMELSEGEKTDYEVCMKRCAIDFKGRYYNQSCPINCNAVVEIKFDDMKQIMLLTAAEQGIDCSNKTWQECAYNDAKGVSFQTETNCWTCSDGCNTCCGNPDGIYSSTLMYCEGLKDLNFTDI